VKIKFEKRDIWVGLLWDHQRVTVHRLLLGPVIRETVIRFYVCVVPCFPVTFDVSFFKEVEA
jgi:hypothetical protein